MEPLFGRRVQTVSALHCADALKILGVSQCRSSHLAIHRLVCGIDQYLSDWFVPVEGVTYLNSPQTERPSADLIQKAWTKCVKEEEKVVLLNGLVSLKPELRPEILALAGWRNVFMADATLLLSDWFAKYLPSAIQARHLRASLGDRDRIHVVIESLRVIAKQQISS